MLEPPRPYSETIMKFVTNVLPFAALALVYVATQVRPSGLPSHLRSLALADLLRS